MFLELFGTFSFKCIAVGNSKPDKVTIVQEVRISHQGSNAEVTVVRKLNQGIRKKSAVYLFFLDFLVLFYQEKSTEEKLLLKINISSRYFTFLSWHKKVTKKVKATEKKLKFLSFRYSEESLLCCYKSFFNEDLWRPLNLYSKSSLLTLHSRNFLTLFLWCRIPDSIYALYYWSCYLYRRTSDQTSRL